MMQQRGRKQGQLALQLLALLLQQSLALLLLPGCCPVTPSSSVLCSTSWQFMLCRPLQRGCKEEQEEEEDGRQR